MDELMKRKNELSAPQSEDTYRAIRGYVIEAQRQVYAAVNSAMVMAYWKIGKSIFEACGENDRAAYGKQVLQYISGRMTAEFGKGFDISNLRNMRRFYLAFPIQDALRPELSWTHYRCLMKVNDAKARNFYLEECAKAGWSSRQLERQKHFNVDGRHFYIDLVFYNIKLKRYVLFELKTHPLTHADVGQLDMYVRMYDDLIKDENDNFTIGILLCTETDKVLAKYSVLNRSVKLFAAKYMAYIQKEEK